MAGAVEGVDSLDGNSARAGPLDFRAHGLEQQYQVRYFRLQRTVFQCGYTLRQRRGHQQDNRNFRKGVWCYEIYQ